MFSVKTNMLAWNAGRQFGIKGKETAKHSEKLSSGYRINRAADDAAGLGISEKMRRQMRGLTQASQNAQDGISMVQTAEGAMNEIHDMLQRANELAVKSANGTLTEEDRAMVDAEVQQLKTEIDTTAKHTVFNEIRLFPDSGMLPSQAQANVWYYDLTYHMADGSFTVDGTSANVPDTQDGISLAAVNPVSAGGALANKIATEFIPKAATQIMDAFPSIKNKIGNDNVDIKIAVSSIDGPGNGLAFAQFTFSAGKFNLSITFDSSDFTMEDANGTGKMSAALESTISHELMHSIMQYTMKDGMKNGGSFPLWFKEGTAQLSGGGFPTNWNNNLIAYAQKLTDADDTSQDAAIKTYLGKYTVDNREYGHGYLAAAYAGWLANGKGDVTGANIAKGMDKIFADFMNGQTFAQAIQGNTGLTEAQLKNHVNSGNAQLVEFVRRLSYESLGGAGSVITPNLNTAPIGMIGSGSVGGGTTNPPNPGGTGGTGGPGGTAGAPGQVGIQVGADSGQHITIELYRMDTAALELSDTNVKSVESSGDAIDEIKKAIGYVSRVRSTYGAIQNRLEHTISNLDNIVENTTASESIIRDTDIAKEMIAYSNNQILLQGGQSVLSQANQQQGMLLSLLS